jgi:hypothetical protein
MMTRDPNEGWYYTHWFITPKERRAPRRGGWRLTLLCLVLVAGGVVAVTMIPG